jgi:hypothetical protein
MSGILTFDKSLAGVLSPGHVWGSYLIVAAIGDDPLSFKWGGLEDSLDRLLRSRKFSTAVKPGVVGRMFNEPGEFLPRFEQETSSIRCGRSEKLRLARVLQPYLRAGSNIHLFMFEMTHLAPEFAGKNQKIVEAAIEDWVYNRFEIEINQVY